MVTHAFLSFGGGVQTTAMLLMPNRDFDAVVFADTGGEMPETYSYIIAITRPYVEKELGIPFVSVKASIEVGGTMQGTLEDYCLASKKTPSMQMRWCTDRWKIRPIRKWVKEEFGAPATALMGISVDEAHRVHDPHWSEYTFSYPLIERRITREECRRIIRSHGWPLPPKSGCFYCPFQSPKRWKDLYHTHPDLFWRAEAVERCNTKYPKFVMLRDGRTLKSFANGLGDGASKLEYFDEGRDECGGSCFV